MPRRTPTAAQEIAHLESHVKEALDARKAGRQDALNVIKRLHPNFRRASMDKIRGAPFSVHDARLVVALEHGFPTWKAIRDEAAKGARARWNLPIHERTDDPAFGRAIRFVNTGNVRALETILRERPTLIRDRVRLEQDGPFSNPSLLEIAAATHRRRDKVPGHLLDTIDVLLSKKPGPRAVQNALNLAASTPWPKHDEAQRQVIRRLIKAGAKPEPAMPRAVFQGAVAALDELVRHGGKLDFIAMAAMGRIPEMKRHLPRAPPLARRKALALAAVNGQTEAVRILLDAGLEPNRFNPPGFYDHSTPIHQAVWFGHLDTVKVLAEHGADLTIRDKAHNGTALGWAVYGKRTKIANYLKQRGAK